MYEWNKNIQKIVDEIDVLIKNKNEESMSLYCLQKSSDILNIMCRENSAKFRE